MTAPRPLRASSALLLASLAAAAPRSPAQAPMAPELAQATSEEPAVPGEALDQTTHGPARIETLADAIRRGRELGGSPQDDARMRGGRQGAWVVPSPSATYGVHSGAHAVVNEWGDTRMGIAFSEPVDLRGAWIAGQAGRGVWPPAVRAIGYRDGVEVAASDWFTGIEAASAWFEMRLEGIDRVVLDARPAFDRAGWYALDDLTYRIDDGREVVVDFDDCEYRQRLTGTRYAGLVWEAGSGFERELEMDEAGMPAPKEPPALGERADEAGAQQGTGSSSFLGGSGTAPVLVFDFQGVKRFDHGSGIYPPDTCGAIGPAHFAEIVNRVFTVYDRFNGAELGGTTLGAFLPGAQGDPRILFDQHSGRWVAMATDFGVHIQIAVSLTADATGAWFKTDFVAAQGTDASCTVDYPTLGVDRHGIYVGAYMFPGCGLTIFAIDKAPLLAPAPSLGTITAFRGLEFDGALHPVHTYGPAVGEYVVSTGGTDKLRLRRVNPPLTAPTLTTVGLVPVGTFIPPPLAPALGSLTGLAMNGSRLMNAVYRDGSVWTTHTVNSNGKAAARWYEIDVAAPGLVQGGTVEDRELHYFYPAISVNSRGDAVLGFTGSSPSQYAGAYFTGRLATDPHGEMAPPELYRPGNGAYNVLDPSGRNRWGDYSLTTLDPLDELTLWTLQEYTHLTDLWGTWIGALEFGGTPICPDAEHYCSTSPNSAGNGALLHYGGTASVSLENLVLQATGCPPNQIGVFYYGQARIALPFGDGIRCVGGGTFRFPPVVTDFFGDATHVVDFDAPPASGGAGALLVGSAWNFQFWYHDAAAGGSGFNLTDALAITICP